MKRHDTSSTSTTINNKTQSKNTLGHRIGAVVGDTNNGSNSPVQTNVVLDRTRDNHIRGVEYLGGRRRSFAIYVAWTLTSFVSHYGWGLYVAYRPFDTIWQLAKLALVTLVLSWIVPFVARIVIPRSTFNNNNKSRRSLSSVWLWIATLMFAMGCFMAIDRYAMERVDMAFGVSMNDVNDTVNDDCHGCGVHFMNGMYREAGSIVEQRLAKFISDPFRSIPASIQWYEHLTTDNDEGGDEPVFTSRAQRGLRQFVELSLEYMWMQSSRGDRDMVLLWRMLDSIVCTFDSVARTFGSIGRMLFRWNNGDIAKSETSLVSSSTVLLVTSLVELNGVYRSLSELGENELEFGSHDADVLSRVERLSASAWLDGIDLPPMAAATSQHDHVHHSLPPLRLPRNMPRLVLKHESLTPTLETSMSMTSLVQLQQRPSPPSQSLWVSFMRLFSGPPPTSDVVPSKQPVPKFILELVASTIQDLKHVAIKAHLQARQDKTRSNLNQAIPLFFTIGVCALMVMIVVCY